MHILPLTGIGYFTLPFLVHGKAAHVHACDFNPNAVEALRINVKLNKVQDRCTVYEGNCAQVKKHFRPRHIPLALASLTDLVFYVTGCA